MTPSPTSARSSASSRSSQLSSVIAERPSTPTNAPENAARALPSRSRSVAGLTISGVIGASTSTTSVSGSIGLGGGATGVGAGAVGGRDRCRAATVDHQHGDTEHEHGNGEYEKDPLHRHATLSGPQSTVGPGRPAAHPSEQQLGLGAPQRADRLVQAPVRIAEGRRRDASARRSRAERPALRPRARPTPHSAAAARPTREVPDRRPHR